MVFLHKLTEQRLYVWWRRLESIAGIRITAGVITLNIGRPLHVAFEKKGLSVRKEDHVKVNIRRTLTEKNTTS